MSLPEELHVEKQYKEGYIPSSWDAPHSSLHQASTWIAMGCILASLSGWGTMMWGLASMTVSYRDDGPIFAITGAIIGAVLLFGGFFLVHVGRKNYREYKQRSGRIM